MRNPTRIFSLIARCIFAVNARGNSEMMKSKAMLKTVKCQQRAYTQHLGFFLLLTMVRVSVHSHLPRFQAHGIRVGLPYCTYRTTVGRLSEVAERIMAMWAMMRLHNSHFHRLESLSRRTNRHIEILIIFNAQVQKMPHATISGPMIDACLGSTITRPYE